MATAYIGLTVTISRTEAQEPKIIDVNRWDIYRVINSVQEGAPIDVASIGNGITVTDPVGDEGARTYSINKSLAVGEDLSEGDTLQWKFIPAGTEADLAGTLDWPTDVYDVAEFKASTVATGTAIGCGVSPCLQT